MYDTCFGLHTQRGCLKTEPYLFVNIDSKAFIISFHMLVWWKCSDLFEGGTHRQHELHVGKDGNVTKNVAVKKINGI